MQAWAGAGWGFQFIPRIGMEVVVTFVGGDTDRPMVTGSVYNAEHPPSFSLPRNKTKSGIKTRSSKGGGGYNELSFEDRTGYELLHMHAQKDMETVARNDHTARVGRNFTEQIGNNRFSVTAGNRIDSIGGTFTRSVAGDERTTTDGSRADAVRGDAKSVVDGRADHLVGGDVHSEVRGEHRHTTGGEARFEAQESVLLRVRGSLTEVIGTHEAPKSLAVHVEGHTELSGTRETVIRSDTAITLASGDSYVRITPSGIEIVGDDVVVRGKGGEARLGDDKIKLRAKSLVSVRSDDKVALYGSGSSVALTADAKIDGAQVKLKSPDSSSENDDADEGQLTTIELVDEEGSPLAGQRFRIVFSDGSERSGALDANGKATLRLPESAEIAFPELGDIETA